MIKKPSNTEMLEFLQENMATKEDLRNTEDRLNQRLDGIGKQLTDLRTENAANIAAHQRFDHRDEVFAAKLNLDLKKIDAAP